MKEHDLRAPVRAHLEAQGYRVWAAPDGRDYFDMVALRGEEIGLVELKVSAARQVFGQALRRRAWADWVAVAIPGRRAAERLLARPSADRAERVGIWLVEGSGLRELRAARPLYGPGEPTPFEGAREQLLAVLRALESGEIPDGVDWGLFGAPRLPGAHRRSTRDWRLEEFPERPRTGASERTPSQSAPPSDQS
ncbi:MAG: hypothetical protein L3J91_04455 [Thermoplasmata archaeon]|nr:hypothetical protein [Thermoplasmata archaeon]